MSVSINRVTAAIRELVEDWARAVRAKDLTGILGGRRRMSADGQGERS
jgi:hypothetical protein